MVHKSNNWQRLCHICMNTFQGKEWGKHQFEFHNKEKYFLCQKVNSHFSKRHNLKKHNDGIHNDCLREYKCKICSNEYPSRSKLQSNVSSVHQPKLFVCTTCSETFNSEAKLVVPNGRKHFKSRTVPCKQCPKKFFITRI